MKTVPITLVTGYLGSGKTTLINNILSNDKGYKFAVIVNDIGEVNLDVELIQKGGIVSLNNDSLVELQNGCICCNLNEDLIKQLIEISQSGRFDHIVIEASGICEPMPIVQSIVAIEEECLRRGMPLLCKLDAVISVTDALRLAKEFGCGSDLQKDNFNNDDIETLIIQQIEFCDVVILNKVDEVTKEELNKVKNVIKQLQPSAKIIETNYSKIDVQDIIDTGVFDMEKSFNNAGWLQAMDNTTEVTNKIEEHHHHEHEHHHEDHEHECYHHEHWHHEHDHHHEDNDHEHECHCHEDGHECTCHEHEHEECDCEDKENHDEHCKHHHHEHHHEHGEGCTCGHCHNHDGTTSEEYGISTFVYFRREPMDRQKFVAWANENWGKSIIRTKGLVYFEDEKDMSYLFEQAGTQKNLTQTGLWYATMPKVELEQMLKVDKLLQRDWDENFGDRMVKLVFIGQHLDKHKIIETLNKI